MQMKVDVRVLDRDAAAIVGESFEWAGSRYSRAIQ